MGFRLGTVALTVAGMAVMSACGGGGAGGGLPPEVRDDPRMAALEEIQDGADTLHMGAVRVAWDLSTPDGTFRERDIMYSRCAGSRCEGSDGSEYSVWTFNNPDDTVTIVDASLRDELGFHTGQTEGRFNLDKLDSTATRLPPGYEYGIWGRHGYAAVVVADGPVEARSDGITVKGHVAVSLTAVLGQHHGTTLPRADHSVRWNGPARAVSNANYDVQSGTASIGIRDLNRPFADVRVVLAGAIAESWEGVPVVGGRFRQGSQDDDFLDGRFYGPGWEEAYAVFDTDRWTGVFGARAHD